MPDMRRSSTPRAATCGVVVVSIFVNPLQFNNQDDLARYPRTLDADVAFCREHGVDIVFAPSAAEVYPQPPECSVDVGRLADHLCGKFRPGHFRGVATVVLKLFRDGAAAPRVFRREGCAAARDRQAARRRFQSADRRRRGADRARSRRSGDELAQPSFERRRASHGDLPVSGAARSAGGGFRAASAARRGRPRGCRGNDSALGRR